MGVTRTISSFWGAANSTANQSAIFNLEFNKRCHYISDFATRESLISGVCSAVQNCSLAHSKPKGEIDDD
jgi:hypothetical protein